MIIQGQRVLTKEGTKFIHEVTMDDWVVGHNGKWVSLVGISKRRLQRNSDLELHKSVRLHVEGEIDSIELTADHHLYVYRDNTLQYVCVSTLTENDYLLSPRLQCNDTSLTDDISWFFGVYCARGKLKHDQVIIILPPETNPKVVKKLCQVAGQVGATKAHANFKPTINSYLINLEGEDIHKLLFETFHRDGSLLPNVIPPTLHESSLDIKTQFILGVMQANVGREGWLCHSLNLSMNLSPIY